MWVLAFETLLKFRKDTANLDDDEDEENSMVEKLKEKEEELRQKIEEVNLYRDSKWKGKHKDSEEDKNTGDELEKMELEGEESEDLLGSKKSTE